MAITSQLCSRNVGVPASPQVTVYSTQVQGGRRGRVFALHLSPGGGYSTTNVISEEWVSRCATHTPVIQRTYYTNASLAVQQLSLHAFLEKQEFYKPPL